MKLTVLNDEPEKFKVGDLVTTGYIVGAENVVRRIIEIKHSHDYSSNIGIAADGGMPCKHCKQYPAAPTPMIDGVWFLPAKAKKKRKAKQR